MHSISLSFLLLNLIVFLYATHPPGDHVVLLFCSNVDAVSITDLTINTENIENGIKGNDRYIFCICVLCAFANMTYTSIYYGTIHKIKWLFYGHVILCTHARILSSLLGFSVQFFQLASPRNLGKTMPNCTIVVLAYYIYHFFL